MPRSRARVPRPPPPSDATVRQQIEERLLLGDASFEGLRRDLLVAARTLEDHLRHVARSARGRSLAFVVTPAACGDCGFVFRGRETRHLHPPGRCPRCRGERIDEPRFRLDRREG